MPYLGRTPAGAAGNKITGDLKVTGVLSADSISNNIVLDGTDGSSSNATDNVVMDGTDSDSTNVDDNLLYEENTGDMLQSLILTDGYAGADFDLGTNTSGTETLDFSNGNYQKGVNGGAHTLTPQINTSSIVVQYTNNGSAGTLTTSGYTIVTGDSLTTTNGHDFMMYSTVTNSFKHLHVVALQ